MLSVTSTPVELIDDNTAQQYYNDLDTLEGAERDSRAEALRLWADQKDADQKREQFDTLNKIYSDFDGYVNDAGLQDFDEESRYRTANRQFIASQFDDTVENQQTIYPSFRDKWTESVAGKKGLSEKETFDLIKQGIDARNEVSQAANEIPGDIALALFDSLDGGDPVDVPKLIDTWKTKNAESIKKLPKGWETPLLEAAQKYHTETDTMLRDYAEPLKQVYDHFAAVTGRDTERAGESNPKNQEELDSLVDTLASMPKPVRERAYASVVLGAKKAGQDPKTFMDQWGESWSRTLNMVRTGALTAQEMAAESEARQLEDKASPPDYYISKSTGEKIPLANRAFHDEADLRKVTPEEIAADAAKARQKVKRFEVVRELQSVADNQFDPIEKINKGGFLGFMEAMAYGTPQSLAYTGTALIPVVGPYLAGTAIFADEYNQLREQGMSVDQAVQVGSVSAGIQAGLERTGAELIFGKLPVFEKLMRRIANPARVGKAGSAGIRFFSAALGENITEGAQDLTTPLVQDVAEALGADVPDVQWQSILEKWSGSRLDVLAATIPTILLGTGVATFGDNKRFAQFEERQDIYRSMGMDDATIKEIEDGKDISEKQQKFQTAFSKLTPENVKAGVAYMEEKIASAQGQQQDPNTPTLTRATLADGSQKFVIRDPNGEVRYSTSEEQTAQIVFRELLRNQITGTTRGIVEALSFFNQVNEAANRGDDIQKFILENTPRNLLDEYEANPTDQNLDNLFKTVATIGQDISEPAELANFPVLASNQGALAEGIFKSVIRIYEGATGDKVVRDVAQDNLKRAIAEQRITMDWVRENLNQIIPQIDSERITQKLRTETDTDVIESFSDVALAYMRGNVRDEQIPAGFRGFLRRMAIVVKDIFRRAYRLKRLVAEGKVDTNFEALLAESVGLNQQTLLDTTRDRVSNEVLTDTNYSIGSKPYPMEDKGKWYANEDFAQRGGRIVTMSPDQFLSQVRPLEVDEASRDNIDDLKNMMQSGRKLDPLAIYADGKEDGRHRAIAAKELGITSIPVIDFRQPVSTDTNYSIGRSDEITGLPLNPNGTVTVYHGTTKESAAEIQRTGILKSAGEPDVYFTTAKEGTGYGDGTVVGVEIDPKQLILDDEFPDGRRDFRVNVGKSKRLAVKLSQNAPDWHSSADDFQKHWTDRGVVNSTQIYGGGKYIKPGKIIVGEGNRNSGLGTEFMRDLTAFADSKAMQIRVTPSKDFGATSVDRLKKFYKRFGFVENSGRNKDYEISDTMYRRPSPGATNYSIGFDLRQVPFGADLAQVWNKFPKSEVSLPDLPENATPNELKKLAVRFLQSQPRNVFSAFGNEVVLHEIKNVKGKAEHFVSGQYRERPPEPNRVRTLQMLAHTIQNAMAYGSAGKNRFAYIYRYNDGTVHVVIVQNAAGKQAIQRQFTITQFDHDTSKQISGIRILRKNEAGPQPTATPEPSPSSAIGASEEPATAKPISEQPSDVNKNYSIASQSEIDRVNRALGGMNRGPDERLKVYERAKAKLSKLMAWNSDELAAMADTGSDDSQIRRTQILQALGELDGILSVLPAEVRGRVGGYTKLASIAPMDVLKDGVKVSEVSGMNGAIISAWMREGQNIGQAGKQVSLPPGYTATENLSTKRADKAIADFFRDRIKKIDAEFEKVVAREYRNAILDLVKKSRPKAGDNNVRKSTLGAETQKLADMVQRATLMDEDATAERMLQLEQTMATSENSADMVEEWGILNQFGDLKNRNSETLAQAYGWFKDQLQMGREAWRIKEEARIAENRERAKKTVEFIGGATAVDRFKDKTFMDRVSDWANSALLDHASFEQFVTALLPPDVAADFSTRLRKADIAAQKAELDQREGILNALREGAKAAGTTTGKAMEMLKTEVPSAVRYLDGRKVKNTKLTIEQAEKIVRGEIDRSDLSDADVRNLADELAALPADTRKENITLKQVTFRGNEVRLPMTRGKAIQLLLSWNQPDVQDKMRREGWNEDSIEDLRTLTNDPVSKAMISHAQELYGKGFGITNPVYARMFGMNMPQVKNYAPTRFLHSNDVKDIGLDGSPVATGTTPGFAKSRVSHSAKIAPEDALSVMQQHILTQAHWVNFAELAREYRSLINNPEIREAIKAKHGTGVLKTAELWADQMEQRGGNQSREAAWVNAILGSVIGGQSVASLGFNLKTLAMQLDNSVRFALALDKKQIMAAMSSPDQLIEDIKTVFESDALQTRLRGGATAETRYMFERFGGKPGTAAKVTEAAMSTINWMDTATTSFSAAIVYRANLNEALEAGMPESLARETALDAAAAAIYRFAQPVSFGQKSNVENSGNIYTKAFFLFMSDPRLKTAIMADAVRGLATGRGDKWTHIRRLVAVELMAVLSHVVASAYRDAFTGDDDEEIWSRGGFVRALALAPLQGFFFAGTMFDSVLSQLTGAGFFTPTQNPLLTVSQTGIRALKNADDILAFDDSDALLKEWSAIARTMAVAPAAAMPAVILNLVKPIFGATKNATTEE